MEKNVNDTLNGLDAVRIQIPPPVIESKPRIERTMARSRDTKKLTVEIDRTLYWKLKEHVDNRGISMHDFFDWIIRHECTKITQNKGV